VKIGEPCNKKSLAKREMFGKALCFQQVAGFYLPASFFSTVFSFSNFGRLLPCEPRWILPRFVFGSPLPMSEMWYLFEKMLFEKNSGAKVQYSVPILANQSLSMLFAS